ncbi:MAG: class I SAM-dependent methyltransferase [Halodesulfurarchaeum sp.]
MDDHVFDAEQATELEGESRYRIISREALLGEIADGETVVDVGSGTGFFTDDIATRADTVYAVDFQEAMHEYYREKGVPENVELVHSTAADIDIPVADCIVSILSLHEIELEAALERFRDLLNQGGKLLVVDWSANAETDDIPPREKLYTAASASQQVRTYFDVREATERYDTFKLLARS